MTKLKQARERLGNASSEGSEKKLKAYLVALAFALFVVVLFGFAYLATTPETTLTWMLSFAGGVSNIVLPCTLPLVFIIVPMAMIARNARKGLVMAALFGVGLIITLSAYGAVTALAGKYLGLDKATMAMYAVAGLAALAFGLTELKLLKLELPSYMGTPEFLQGTKGDYSKAFLLGLFLGNAGVGCPNPVTYVILSFAATTGDWVQGAALMAVNGLGRVMPLLFLTVLGIIGVNAVDWLTTRVEGVKKFTGWALVVLGSFILLNGIFGHYWYEGGVFHEGLNAFFMAIGGKMLGEEDAPVVELRIPFAEYASFLNLAPVAWYWRRFPSERLQVAKIAVMVLLWGLLLFDVGLTPMQLLGGQN